MTSIGRPKNRVAVIGAGMSGLVVAKRLKAEGMKVTIYERQTGPGGVWKFTRNADGIFATAAYETLESNFIKYLMEFSDWPWKDDTLLFPNRESVEQYLQTYSTGLDIEYDTEVIDIFGRSRIQPNDWQVKTRNCKSGEEVKRDFNAVVIAIGTFDKPYVPNCIGLEEWKSMHPGSISHSKSYRDADTEAFRGKNVVVVGNAASGRDISLRLAEVTKKLWVSSTRPNGRSHKRAIPVKGTKRLVPEKRLIEFEGNEEAREVDNIIYCTGYLYNTPFLRKGKNARTSLFPNNFYMDDLYEHIFWTKRPTLSFVGVPKLGPTFLISQAQSAVIARCLSTGLTPTAQVMAGWINDEKARHKERTYHGLPYPKCKEYIVRLEEWYLEVDEVALDKAPEGNKPFRWTDRLDWMMKSNAAIRRAFAAKKRLERQSFTTPESLGFVETKSNK
ncbi:FAD/NAD(P)-binding domain-containing protein [Whalleya microplaca]|nr:FAD/NAD(P)-binding domain-containing protein [Whalleya microplaca]